MDAPLFETMDRFDQDMAPLLFMEHMRVAFELDQEQQAGQPKSFGISYLRMLRGWLFDANRPEGAVMKGWAESRFGLRPLFHKEPINSLNDDAYYIYLMEKMSPRFNNNAIFSQFDILYEYCQYFLERFAPVKGKKILYRAINLQNDDARIIKRLSKRDWIVRNNCLTSYSACRERASEFGDVVLEVEVPYQKIFCCPEILPGTFPTYEHEAIVLGGDFLSKKIDVF